MGIFDRSGELLDVYVHMVERVSTWFHVCVQPHGFVKCVPHYRMCVFACLNAWLLNVCPNGWMCVSMLSNVCVHMAGCMRLSTWLIACVHIVEWVCPHGWMCVSVSTSKIEKHLRPDSSKTEKICECPKPVCRGRKYTLMSCLIH